MEDKDSLAVIMPVYNEEGAIVAVLDQWLKMLDGLIDADYQIHVYNDGSKDGTKEILARYVEGKQNKLIVHNKPNSGHGATILQGYRENSPNADWLFQIDSDDEMGPELFPELWKRRRDYDFLLGIREGRKQALPRKIISLVSRLVVRLFYGNQTVWDVNSPYRLMRSEAFSRIYQEIPTNTFAPNVIISGMVAKIRLRYYQQLVPQRDRQTGEVSIKKWKLFKAAVKSFWQTIQFAFR